MNLQEAILDYNEVQWKDWPNSHLTMGKYFRIFGKKVFMDALNEYYAESMSNSKPCDLGWCTERTSDDKLCPIQEEKPGSKQCWIHRQQAEVK